MPLKIESKVLNEGVSENTLKLLKEWGEYLSTPERVDGKVTKSALSTSQIRKFFGEIKRIQADFETLNSQIILLDPKIAYAVGRAEKDNKKSKISDFYKLMNPLLFEIKNDKKRFKVFVSIIESIVAYHKASGGE